MVDYINDYRGRNNRYEVHKHNNLKKEKELHRIKRKKLLSSRSPTKNTLVTPYTCFDCDTTDTLDNQWKPVFLSKEDCLAFQLHDLIKTDNIEGMETLLLYSVPSLLEKSINICGRPERWLCPMESPLMAAARQGNDRIVRMFLNKCSTVDINLTIDANIELKRDKTSQYWTGYDWICAPFNDNFDESHLHSCHGFCCDEQFTYRHCYCACCSRGFRENGFGRTALWLACFYGHLEVVRTLIEIGKADINISDHKNWTPLRAAICQGHIDIVRYLIEQFNAVIDETRDFFIAIKYGHFHIIDYLLNQGCDPNTRLMDEDKLYWYDNYTYFALHYTVDHHSENLSIIKTLLKHGSDPTIKDEQSDTALHLAIRHQNKEIVQEILHYGFKHDQRNESDLTPLMLAIDMDLTDIIDIFYQILPRQQYIDEIMLLGSHYALIYRWNNFINVNPQALIYFEQGLKLQEPNSNAQPCDLYQFRQECQTIDELRAIQFNPELMHIQALLVYERLLTERNEVYLLIPKLFDFYLHYSNIQDYERCLFILIHLYPMILSCKKENRFYVWDKYCLKSLVDVLSSLIIKDEIKYINYIFQALEWTCTELYNDNAELCRLCLCVAYLIGINQIDINKKCQLIRLVKEAIRQNYASTLYNYNMLFHQAIVTCVYNTEPLFEQVSHRKFLHLLIYCDADINQYCGYSPLHQVALISDYEYAQSVIEILIAAGTHTDCLDYKGLLPEEQASNLTIRNLLHTKRSRSLKCQCAHLIISKGIQYQPSSLSDRLKSFIFMHQSR